MAFRVLPRLALAFLVSTACADKPSSGDASEETSVGRDVATELDLWAGVPPLEPATDDVAPTLEPRPGPQKPPTVGERIEAPFPPEDIEPAGGESREPGGPLKVERFGPEGDQALVDAVRIAFDQPMVPLAAVETLKTKSLPFEIDPPIAGEPRWLGTRTLAYFAEGGRIPYSTTYQVTVPKSVRSTHGAQLERPVRWSFTTPPLQLEWSSPQTAADEVVLQPHIVLRFNQAIQRVALGAALELRGGGSTVPLLEVPMPPPGPRATAEAWQHARTIALVPKVPLRADTAYTLRLPPGVYGEGPNRSADLRVAFHTYRPLGLSVATCLDPCWASQGIRLESTTRIADPTLSKKIRVEPAVPDLRVSSSGQSIHLGGSFVGETTYAIEVDAGVTDVHGQTLAKPFRASVRLGPQAPALSVANPGRDPGVIEKGADQELPIVVAGLEQIELHARALSIDELDPFLDFWPRGEYAWPEDKPAPLSARVLDVRTSRRHRQRLTLDLEDVFGPGRNVARLVVRSNPYTMHGWTQRSGFTRLVQVTDLGPSAALDRSGGLVLVTRLSNGAPVMAGGVRILDASGTELWRGTTDPTGLAYPEYDLRHRTPRLLVVEHEGDSAFMRIDQADLRGRWVGSWAGARQETPRAFFFTDRTPYKPGETIHLVGVLRKETRGPQGGVEAWARDMTATYTVTTPRGIDVANGDVRIGPFGTFAVDIPTDADGDTGDYRFAVTIPNFFTGDRTFTHAVPVEAFRAPEFEVQVSRPSSVPLRFGQKLVARIEGRYFHGAPLVGGTANWVLRRSPSDFRPPGAHNEGFDFGTTPRWGSWRGSHATSSTVAAQGEGALDERGVLEVAHPMRITEKADTGTRAAGQGSPKEDLASAATFTLEATVTDRNLQSIAGRASFVVHPAAVYVGLRSDRRVLQEGSHANIEAIAVDLEGERAIGRRIAIDVLRRTTERKPVEKDGVWTFELETRDEPIEHCDVISAPIPMVCPTELGAAGSYIVRATTTDEDGRATHSQINLYVHGKDAVVWDETRNRVDLVPDKRTYAPGDTATILLRSPFDEAKGVVVVEREGIVQRIPVWVQGGAMPVSIPITETMQPRVTVSAMLVRGRVEVAGAPAGQDLGMPAAAVGEIDLDVSTDSKRIVVELEPTAREIGPKDTLALTIRTKTVDGEALPAALAVMVVDEAVLSLMGFSTPDPSSFFHHPRPGEVGLHALQANVLPRQRADASPPTDDPAPDEEAATIQPVPLGAGTGTGVGYGRGAESKPSAAPQAKRMAQPAAKEEEMKMDEGMIDVAQAMAQPVSLRTLFATTAFFDADVRTDEDGRVELSIPMPENLTTFRLMAVAIDPDRADRFGHGESTVRVRKPIMVRPSLPRFANYGDRFDGSVMVDNQTGQEQSVLVGTRGLNVTLHGATESMVRIPAGESREVRFDMEVARVGNMRLQFAAMSNAGRDATELSLPVHFPATTKAFADYGMTDGSIQRTVEPPEDALSTFGGLQLSFSSTALSGLEDAVRYLVDYPYECTEQTASRILPIFALSKILDDFPVAELRDRARRDALVEAGIERLLSAQNHDGGFGLWTPRESWPHLTNWVTFALLEGQRAGHEVDDRALSRALAFVERFVRHGHQSRWGTYYDWTSRAFGLWLLSSQSRGAEDFERVWAHRGEMPLYARAMLMGAAHRYGKASARDEILSTLRASVIESARTIHFAESRSEAASSGLRLLMHSNVQTDAIVLANLLEVAPDDPMLPKIIAGIMAERGPERGGRWRSTHANAWALVAANRYYETVESEEPDYLARVWLDAQFAGEHTFMGRSMATVEQLVPMASLLGAERRELTVLKKGTGKLYYRLGLRYAPADLQLDAVDNGFTVYRTYEALGTGDDPADPEAVKRLDDGSWQIKAGTNVKATIHLVVRDRVNYVVVDDPLPAGFEGQNPRFVTSVGVNPADTGPQTTVDRGRGSHARWWWPWFTFDHTQMRDDRMLLFADHLPAGVYTYAYTARATARGRFHLPPVKAEAMYEPEIFGHGSSSRVHVVD